MISQNVKRILVGSGALIALYLVLVNFTGFKEDVNAVSSAYQGGVTTLQGR
jgi:2-keto-3-deoxy-galactonokinase